MGLVSEYNQAVTPTRFSPDRSHPRREAPLLTPPAENPLRPYGLGNQTFGGGAGKRLSKRDSSLPQSDNFQSSLETLQKNDQGNSWRQTSSQPDSYSASGSDSRLPKEVAHELHNIIAQGQKIGIEHVDQRRFRINSWQSYGTLSQPDEREAIALLASCLKEFPQHYIRLVSIDPKTNRRINEPIIQRP